MEGTGADVIQEIRQPTHEVSQREVVFLWQSVEQGAARARLKLLIRIKEQSSQIDQEISNIYMSINWLTRHQDSSSAELLIRYLETLEAYLHLRGRDFDLASWCLKGLDACELLRRNPSRISFILGNAQYALGQWEQANTSWQAAIEASHGKDQVVYAHATSAIGRLQMNQGNYKIALKALSRAEQLLNEINETQAIINVRSEVAAYYLNRRELEKALSLYLEIEGLQKKSSLGRPSNHISLMLGVVYRHMKMFDKAIEYLSTLCRYSEAQKDISSLATATHHLAWTYFELRELEQARYLCGKALALYEDLHDPRGLSDGYEQLGAILLEEEKYDEAIRFLEQSAQMRKQIGNRPGYTSSMRRLALVYAIKGKRKQAWKLLVQILENYLQFGTLSRERIISLSRDFFIGVKKVILKGFIKVSRSETSMGNYADSVMENFSRSLMQPKK